ncbi:MAG: CoA transferase [Hyphomicrobiaceae bacterium]|nr:CoA transferase [Hyphomicrobiaceae bacterium]
MRMGFPLQGVRIISIEQYGAGPFGTMQLADLGAEIIKIENAAEGGDVGRHVRHPADPLPAGDSMFHQAFNRNKRSITLDLKKPEGQDILHLLVGKADAVFNNLRGDLPDKLGLTYDALKPHNERIVCVHLSAYGRHSERASWPGYDYLMQAECGYLAVTGEPDGPPARMGLSLVDLSTGLQAAIALSSGIIGARATGKGGDYDVSLYDAAIANVCYVGAWYLTAGINTGRCSRSAHPNLTPSQLYRTKDGWVFLMCNKEKFWPALCEALERPDLAADSEYATFADRLRNRDRLTDVLDEALSSRTTGEWMQRFAGKVPAAPVNDIAGALDNPFTRSTGQIISYEAPDGTMVTSTGPAIRLPGEKPIAHAAPALSADLSSVLAEIGIDDEELAELKRRRVV